MIKHALHSYLAAIDPKVKKEDKRTPEFGSILLFVVYIPFINVLSDGAVDMPYLIGAMITAVPILLMLYSNLNSRYMMSKAMYLCPMNYEDRKKYINAVLVVKIGIPMVLGIIVNLIWSCFYGLQIVNILIRLFVTFSLGITLYLCMEGRGKGDKLITFGRKKKDGTIVRSVLSTLNIVFCGVAIGVFGMGDYRDCKDMGLWLYLGLWLGTILVFDIFIIRNQYKNVVESLSDYETNFRILSEVPVQKPL